MKKMILLFEIHKVLFLLVPWWRIVTCFWGTDGQDVGFQVVKKTRCAFKFKILKNIKYKKEISEPHKIQEAPCAEFPACPKKYGLC